MSKNKTKDKIKKGNYYKSKRVVTGDYKKDIPWVLQYIDIAGETLQFRLEPYLQKNLPHIYDEMLSNPYHAPWIKGSSGNRKVMGVLNIKYNQEIVGCICYNILSFLIEGIVPWKHMLSIETIYLLKDFRGKQLVPEFLKEFFQYCLFELNMEIIPAIESPSYALMGSLKKAGAVIPSPLHPHIWVSMFYPLIFVKDGERFITTFSFFYDTNLKTIVQITEDGLILGDCLGVDIVHNAIEDRVKYQSDKKYMYQLIDDLKETQDYFGDVFN